jgi:hypothetical protein
MVQISSDNRDTEDKFPMLYDIRLWSLLPHQTNRFFSSQEFYRLFPPRLFYAKVWSMIPDLVENAKFYQSEGADELAMLDIAATLENRRTRLEWA